MIELVDQQSLDYAAIDELYLNNNNLQNFSNWFSVPTDKLFKRLEVSFNQIKKVDHHDIEALNKITQLNISNNPWICDCKNYYHVMVFLMQYDIISCSPQHCQSQTDRVSTVSIDCSNKDMTSLPDCLPYPKVTLNWSSNNMTIIEFTRQQENITFLNISQNKLTTINGNSMKFLRQLTEVNTGKHI